MLLTLTLFVCAVDTYYTVTVPTTYTVAVPDPVVYYYATPVEVCFLLIIFVWDIRVCLGCNLSNVEFIIIVKTHENT